MALTDFFRINFPYGISRNENDEWYAFNREYLPLGWNDKHHDKVIASDSGFSGYPIHTKYKGVSETKLKKTCT